MPEHLTYVVDCYGVVHIVAKCDLAEQRSTMVTYYKSGKPISEFPPSMRYRAVRIQRESIASVAVRLRKWTPLDDRIARKCRHMVTGRAF